MTYTLLSYRGVIIEPLREGTQTASGITVIQAADRWTPYVLARVLHTHPACVWLKGGEVIITPPHAFDTITWSGGTFQLMHENNALAIVEGYDDAVVEWSHAWPSARTSADVVGG